MSTLTDEQPPLHTNAGVLRVPITPLRRESGGEGGTQRVSAGG
jgi:hypothetical protein